MSGEKDKEYRQSNFSDSNVRNKKHQSMNFAESKQYINDLTKETKWEPEAQTKTQEKQPND